MCPTSVAYDRVSSLQPVGYSVWSDIWLQCYLAKIAGLDCYMVYLLGQSCLTQVERNRLCIALQKHIHGEEYCCFNNILDMIEGKTWNTPSKLKIKGKAKCSIHKKEFPG